jgi:UDP-N-acetyl-D-galactosamine dehydrogenase
MLKNGINVANATVGVLGIAFKENCPDVRNSKVIDVIRELQHWGLTVKVMDPWASPQEVQEEYGVTLTQITPDTTVDSLIVAVAHIQFAQMSPSELKKLCATHSKPVIADLKALYGRKELESQGFEVFRF